MTETIAAPGLKAVLLYTEAANITDEGLKLLTDAGYVPIKVASPEDVRLLALQVTPNDLGSILRAALTALNKYSEGPPTHFGNMLVKLLLEKNQ